MRTLKERAAAIIDRAWNTDKRLAVFVHADGEIRAYAFGTKLCKRMLASDAESLVGIYDKAAPVQWLADDLAGVA